MTARTRTPAEVEAGARALGLEIFPNLVFDTVPESTQASFRRWTTACLTAAADAAAAPAVGVTVAWLDKETAWVAARQVTYAEGSALFERAVGYLAALGAIRALLEDVS